MHNKLNISYKNLFPISIILILTLSRLIPHPPNFTPIIAVAIMSSYFFKNIYLSCATLLISMLLADAFIGFYGNMLFVYLSLTKKLMGNTFSLKLSNLLNERYEKPATYSQDGRQIRFGFIKNF